MEMVDTFYILPAMILNEMEPHKEMEPEDIMDQTVTVIIIIRMIMHIIIIEIIIIINDKIICQCHHIIGEIIKIIFQTVGKIMIMVMQRKIMAIIISQNDQMIPLMSM